MTPSTPPHPYSLAIGEYNLKYSPHPFPNYVLNRHTLCNITRRYLHSHQMPALTKVDTARLILVYAIRAIPIMMLIRRITALGCHREQKNSPKRQTSLTAIFRRDHASNFTMSNRIGGIDIVRCTHASSIYCLVTLVFTMVLMLLITRLEMQDPESFVSSLVRISNPILSSSMLTTVFVNAQSKPPTPRQGARTYKLDSLLEAMHSHRGLVLKSRPRTQRVFCMQYDRQNYPTGNAS